MYRTFSTMCLCMYTHKEHVDVHATLIRATISDLGYAYLTTRFIATGRTEKRSRPEYMEKMTESDLEN